MILSDYGFRSLSPETVCCVLFPKIPVLYFLFNITKPLFRKGNSILLKSNKIVFCDARYFIAISPFYGGANALPYSCMPA